MNTSFKNKISKEIAKVTDFDSKIILDSLEVPQDESMGDYAFACFKLAKELKKAPNAIAAEISEKLNAKLPKFLKNVVPVNAYINFKLNPEQFAKAYLDDLHRNNPFDLKSKLRQQGKGKTICIDYSSVNIAKQFHMGHLSTTVIGASLYRLYNYLGYKTVGINHLGDYGSQFGKLIYAYKLWNVKGELNLKSLTELYQRFTKEAKENEELSHGGKLWFKKLEDGDKEALELFTKFKTITLSEVDKIYKLLGVTFDSYAGESFYSDKMDIVYDLLEKKKLIKKKDDGALYVDLEAEGLQTIILKRSDGASLYATRDLAAAIYRKNTYNFAKCLYVVAYQQNLHFKQVFAILEKAGLKWASDLEHIAYGMVSINGQALSTREGNVILLEDAIEMAINKAKSIISEKNPDLKNKDKIAKAIGIGALVFAPLFNNRIKDVDFNYDKALSFEGDTSVYIQYTYARANTVLDKAKNNLQPTNSSQFCDEYSFALIKSLSNFKTAIENAIQKNEPSFLARCVLDIAKKYNTFYTHNRILDAEEALKNARLNLTHITMQKLKLGLELLGIETVNKM